MARVYVIVEGPTEESFLHGPLAEILWQFQVFVTPIILGVPGHKGGRTNYARLEKDILTQLRQDPGSYCTTMIDFYGLGDGFPGTPVPGHLSNIQKVEHIERAVRDDVCNKIPDFRPDARLIPYLSLHEYEGLLFSDPERSRDPLASQIFRGSFAEFATTSQLLRTSTTVLRPLLRSE